MSKKIFALFLAVFIMLFAVSSAMGDIGYKLAGPDGDDPDEPEAYEINPDHGYAGASFSATYTQPELILYGYDEEDEDELIKVPTTYKIEWSISPDISGLTVTESSNASKDLILSGTLPGDVKTYDFGFVAKVVNVADATYKAAEGVTYVFDTTESLEVLSGDISYKLAAPEGPEEDPEEPDGDAFNNAEEGYKGTNYKAIYTRPQLVLWEYREADPDDLKERHNMLTKTSFDIAWTLSPDISGLSFTLSADDKYDTLILSGTLPDEVKTYTCDIVATVANVTNNTYKTALEGTNVVFSQAVTVDILEDTDHSTIITPSSSNFSDYVVPASGVTVTDVNSSYSVVVNAPQGILKNYTAFIQSDDDYKISLPEWLTVSSVTYAEESDLKTDVALSDFSKTPIKSITLTFKSIAGLKNGTTGSVNIPYYTDEGDSEGPLVNWNVTYTGSDVAQEEEKERPFGISGSREVNFSFTGAGTKSQDISYYGTTSITAQIANDLRPNVELNFSQSKDGYTGKITVTATVPSTTAEGDYSTSFKIIDLTNTTRSVDIPVKVTVNKSSPSSFVLSADKTELNLTVGDSGNSGNIALSITGIASSALTWNYDYDANSLELARAAGSDLVIITVKSTAEEGSYPVKITATDGSNNSKTIEITVKVTKSGGDDPGNPDEPEDPLDPFKTFKLSSDITALSLDINNSQDITITATTNVVSWDWLVSGDETKKSSGITVDIIDTVSGDNSADIVINVNNDTEADDYVVIISAGNAAGKQASIDIALTVNDFDLELTAASTDIQLTAGGEPKNVTITANKNVSWVVDENVTGVTAVITEQTNKTAVITITPGSQAASTSYPVTVKATDKAGKEESIVINVTVSNPVSKYTVSASPSSVEVVAGGDAVKSTITASDGYHDTIHWSITSLPKSITAKLSSSTGKSTDITINAETSAASGDYELVVTASDGYATKQTAKINVKVTIKGTFEISASPTSLNLEAGGYSQSVAMSVTGTPVGKVSYRCTGSDDLHFSIPQGSSLVYIDADSEAEAGTKTVTITGTDDSGVSAYTTITVIVEKSGENSFTLKVSPASVEVVAGGDAATATVTASSGYTGTLKWAISSLPSGIVATLSSVTGAETTVNIRAINSASVGDKSLIITAVDANEVSKNATITVNVTSGGGSVDPDPVNPDDPDNPQVEFNLSTETTAAVFDLAALDTKEIEIKANKNVVSWDWVVSGDESNESGINVTITSSDRSADISINVDDATVSGDYELIISAITADGSTANIVLTLTVTDSSIDTDDFTLTASPQTLVLTAGGNSRSVNIVSTKNVISWNVAANGIAAAVTASTDKSATISVTPSTNALNSAVLVTAKDEEGTEKTISVPVTVNAASTSFTLTASPATLDVTVGGSSASSRITSSAGYTGTLSWEVTSLPSGLTADLSNTTGINTTVAVSATNTATTGTKTLIVTATDSNNVSRTATITVNVTSGGGSGGTEDEEAAREKRENFIREGSYATPQNTDNTVVEGMSNNLKTLLNRQSAEVKGLQANDFGETKTVAETDIQEDYSTSSETPVLALPELPITESKLYVIALNFNDFVRAVDAGLLSYGSPIFAHMRPYTAAQSDSVNTSSLTENDKGTFVDNSGNPITVLPLTDDNGINIAAYLEANTIYSPVISTKSGDVSEQGGIGPSGAGCNGGFGSLIGFLAMAFASSSLYLRKKVK